jgi:glycerate kinase
MISSLLLFASIASANDFSNIKQGEPAPFDGTLLKPEAMATIFATHDAEIAECKLKAQHDLEKEQIECELDVQKIEYDFGSYKVTASAIIEEKDKELEKLYDLLKKQNKNQTPLWIGVGFAGGIVTSIGMIYIYEAIKK